MLEDVRIGNYNVRNVEGEIINIKNTEILIDFYEDIGGHRGDGNRPGNKWWVDVNMEKIELISPKKIKVFGIVNFINSINKKEM